MIRMMDFPARWNIINFKPLITRDLQGYFDYDDILYLY